MELTQERLKELLNYDPETGVFTWRAGRRGVKKNHIAGCSRKRGEIIICIDYKYVMAHRLAWLYMTGRWPENYIDHRNLSPSDNRWANLREATTSQNGANRTATTPSGLKGAYKSGQDSWWSGITVGGKLRYLGTFKSAEDAHAAYMDEAKKSFGDFARP